MLVFGNYIALQSNYYFLHISYSAYFSYFMAYLNSRGEPRLELGVHVFGIIWIILEFSPSPIYCLLTYLLTYSWALQPFVGLGLTDDPPPYGPILGCRFHILDSEGFQVSLDVILPSHSRSSSWSFSIW